MYHRNECTLFNAAWTTSFVLYPVLEKKGEKPRSLMFDEG